MIRYRVLKKKILFLLLVLLYQVHPNIKTSTWGEIANLNIQNYIDLYKIPDWKISTFQGQAKENLPLYSIDYDSLKLSNVFVLSNDSLTSDYLFKSNGFHGVVKVFINDVLVFESPNGSTPFQAPVSRNILKTGKNSISILLTKSLNLVNSFPVFTKIFNEPEYLGIIRPFYLIPDNQYLTNNFGYSVTEINSTNKVDYSYSLNNAYLASLENKDGLSFLERLTDSKGITLASRAINYSQRNEKIHGTLNLDPKYMWSPDNPVILNLDISILRFGQQVIHEAQKVAFRNIQNNNKIIFVNENAVQIRGISYYQNIENLAKWPILSNIRKYLKAIKDNGFNAVRFTSHIPDESFLYAADSIGLLVFIDMPVKRYPADAFKQDNLLENLKNLVSTVISEYGHHPSFAAIGLGNEILLSDPSIQKFFLILNTSLVRSVPFLTYLSAAPETNLTLDKVADFYMLDIYDSVHNRVKAINDSNIPFSLAGKAAISKTYNYLNNDDINFSLDRKKLISKEINSIINKLGFQGGFYECFMDWRSTTASHQTLQNANFEIRNGLYDDTFKKYDWVKELSSPVWDFSYNVDLDDSEDDKSTNIFSIVLFFISLLFFFFYRRYPRLSENYSRSLKHPYGFYVDLRERRIIPVFNSFMTGVHNSLILTIFIGSFFYYYNNSFFMQELLSTVFPPSIYQYILEMSQSVWLIIITLFIIISLYPLYIGVIVKVYSFFSKRGIRTRQALAIGLWSGSPVIFLLPFSIAAYHFILKGGYNKILLIIFSILVIWIQFRLINGIRVLLLSKFQSIFLLLLLSYSVPVVIFLLLFDHQPMWTDYLITLINSHTLF